MASKYKIHQHYYYFNLHSCHFINNGSSARKTKNVGQHGPDERPLPQSHTLQILPNSPAIGEDMKFTASNHLRVMWTEASVLRVSSSKACRGLFNGVFWDLNLITNRLISHPKWPPCHWNIASTEIAKNRLQCLPCFAFETSVFFWTCKSPTARASIPIQRPCFFPTLIWLQKNYAHRFYTCLPYHSMSIKNSTQLFEAFQRAIWN